MRLMLKRRCKWKCSSLPIPSTVSLYTPENVVSSWPHPCHSGHSQHTNTKSSIKHQRIKSKQLLLKLLRNLSSLLQVLKIALLPLDLADIPILFQFLHSFISMVLFLGQYVNLLGVVLENVGDDAKT